MIRYRLNCERGHAFDSWFKSSDGFDKLARRRAVACPQCGSTKVEKAMMAPSVARAGRKATLGPIIDHAEGVAPIVPAAGPQAEPTPALEQQRQMIEMMRKVRQTILETAENVGPKLAEEARKMHYHEAPARGIYGQASVGEARELKEEGIELMPLPSLPEDHN